MARCNHDSIGLSIEITRLVVATVTAHGACHVARNEPTTAPLRITAHCLACGYNTVVTTLSAPTPTWMRWPVWLLNRLTHLRHDLPELDEAMSAVGIPDNSQLGI